MPDQITNLSVKDLEDFFRLLPRIYDDYRDPNRGRFKLVYVFSETPDNEESCFLRAVELVKAGAVESLGIAEGELGHGYEGYDHSVKRLQSLGFKDEVPIVKFDLGDKVNTLSEAQRLVDFGRAHKGDIGIVAPPHHLVRAFMTTVTALSGQPARVYSIPGVSVSWMQRVVHSQGVLVNTRAGLLVDELQRLEKYRASEFGGMLPPSKVIEYLDWRDS